MKAETSKSEELKKQSSAHYRSPNRTLKGETKNLSNMFNRSRLLRKNRRVEDTVKMFVLFYIDNLSAY